MGLGLDAIRDIYSPNPSFLLPSPPRLPLTYALNTGDLDHRFGGDLLSYLCRSSILILPSHYHQVGVFSDVNERQAVGVKLMFYQSDGG